MPLSLPGPTPRLHKAAAARPRRGETYQETAHQELRAQLFTGVRLDSLRLLDLSNNNIVDLPAGVFHHTPQLKILAMTRNKRRLHLKAGVISGLSLLNEVPFIVDLPAGVFHHTPRLHILAMTRNKRRLHLKAGVISGLSLLNELVLRSDDKLELDSRSLSDLPALQTLDLKDSAISELPADLFHNSTAIVSLLLENNNLSSLPETVFEGLEKLQTLVLSSNKLQKVTGKMFQSLVGLREIYLDENLIEVLPEYLFSTMSRLKSVSIANNRIRTVNGYCFQGAASVTTLDLSRNELALSCPVYAGNERLTPTATLALWIPAGVLIGWQWIPLLVLGYRPHVPPALALIAPIASEAATTIPVLCYLTVDERLRAALLGRMRRQYALLRPERAKKFYRS
ncbi:Uncharacterized protein OBRU01_03850 [Operophtera brumata]|uniref:Uncharacterized protein n=1 Tax=Operophtera brumata TaxID=104452 RepID=A0A0L7LH46_OPEBR|nr:Uncharacterized protein OBRU01_03850 [Operophtera brumata]